MATGISKTKWNGQNLPEDLRELTMSLEYEGKTAEKDVLALEPAQTSTLWAGANNAIKRLYYGDNLLLLATLLQDTAIRGKVKLIYIDPPFATNSVFQSRSLNDAYHDLLRGAHYVEFIRQRLIFLRELLAEDGSIYVHLDDNMAFHIKIVMDEIFGQKNFRSWITRRKSSHKNYTRKTYGNISDYILFYTKSDEYIWNRPLEEWTTNRAIKEYPCVEPETGRRYKKVPIHAPGIRHGATGGEWRGMLPPPGKHWQYTPDKLDAMDARGEIYWSPTGNPRRKIYLEQSEGVPVQDIWFEFRDSQNQNTKITGYPTEKNIGVLERIIGASSNPGDLVLDCFCGSGTTIAIAEELGRQWIGIDKSSEAITTTLRRFVIGSEPMGDFVNRAEQQTQQRSLFDETLEKKTSVSAHQAITQFDLITLAETDEPGGILDEWTEIIKTAQSASGSSPQG